MKILTKSPLAKTFLAVSFFMIFGQLKAQNKHVEERNYQFNKTLFGSLSKQKESGGTVSDIVSGYKVNVVGFDKNGVVYQYLKFTDATSDAALKYNNKTFHMSEKEFLELTTPIYRRFKGVDVGVYTVPFRLRGLGSEEFDFESSLSLQSNLVFGFGSRLEERSWFDVSAGVGLTSVALSSLNSEVTEDRTASAFTISLGCLYKPVEKVNVGLFLGWDNLGLADKSVNWKYDGKRWVGLGINIAFNSIKTNKEAQKEIENEF